MNQTASTSKDKIRRAAEDRVRRKTCEVERRRLLRRAAHNCAIQWVDTLLANNDPRVLMAQWCADHEGFKEFAQRMLSRRSTKEETQDDDSVREAFPLRPTVEESPVDESDVSRVENVETIETVKPVETADSNREMSSLDYLLTKKD